MPDEPGSTIMGQALEGPKGLSIRTKLTLTLAGLVTLSLALLAVFTLQQSRRALLREAIHRGLIVGRNLADYSAGAVLQRDTLQAIKFTNDALSDDAMVYALLTDNNGVVLAVRGASGRVPVEIGSRWTPPVGTPVRDVSLPPGVRVVDTRDPASGLRVLALDFPVVDAGVTVGRATIALSQGKILALMRETTVKVAMLAALFILLALIAAVLLADLIVRPVRRLTRGALAVGAGNLDARVDVRGSDELGVLARTFNAMTQGLKRAQVELVEKQLLKQELDIAQEIQRGLLPKKVPLVPGYELAAYYAPAKEVGGDLYDFIPLGGGRLALAVADVSGKSVPGSLGMAMARSVLRAQAFSREGPAETLRRTNAVLQPDIRRGMFVTLFYAVLDAGSNTLTCANAGHNPAYWLHRGQVEEVGPEGMALGLAAEADFFIEERTLELGPGDLFVLYTDGVTEAMNGAREEFGEGRFQRALAGARGLPLTAALDAVMESVRAFVGGAPPHDDITLVLLRRGA